MQEDREESVTRHRHDRVRTISQDVTVDSYFDLVVPGKRGEGHSHTKRPEVLVISLRSIKQVLWSHMRCS